VLLLGSAGLPSRLLALIILCAVPLVGCSSATTSGEGGSSSAGDMFPDVIEVAASAEDDDTYTFEVTMTSPYDTPERYADGWRVLAEDGTVLGTMKLDHDHAEEQPFTRIQTGVEVPDGTDSVEVEGHDQANGYGGDTVSVDLPLP
jgi:hypothetical protein